MTNRKGFMLCAVIILTLISAKAISGEANFVSREQMKQNASLSGQH